MVNNCAGIYKIGVNTTDFMKLLQCCSSVSVTVCIGDMGNGVNDTCVIVSDSLGGGMKYFRK